LLDPKSETPPPIGQVRLAHKLAEYSMPVERLAEIARAAMAGDPGIITAAIADLVAIRTRDPAAELFKAVSVL